MNTVGSAIATGDVTSVGVPAALTGLTMVGSTDADADPGACGDGMCSVPEPAPTS